MDITEILIRIIESIKGLTGYGVISLGMLCATACFFAWLRVTHSCAWLQATPEQLAARTLMGGKPIKPPKDPPSPILPLAMLLLFAACMLWPRDGAGLARIPNRHRPACTEASHSAPPVGDFTPDLRPRSPMVLLAGYR